MSFAREQYQIKKHKTVLLDALYKHPRTSCLVFSFEPMQAKKTYVKLSQAKTTHVDLEGKALYIIDGFFQEKHAQELRLFFDTSSFSRSSYGSAEAILQGERPAKTMNGKERYTLLDKPPEALQEIFKILGLIAFETKTEITTLPWELCDEEGNGSPAVIVNKLERSTKASREFGKHKDVDPESKISFGIPKLYKPGEFFNPAFKNGDTGKPLLITVMLYTTASNYQQQYQMGTVFYHSSGEIALRVRCNDMRIVIFEGDIEHSIEESLIHEEIATWRVSTVLKLVMNPLDPTQSAKTSLEMFFKTFSQDLIYEAKECVL